MPTYEYKCDKCGITIEKFQSMKDAPLSACPSCEGNLKRLIGTGGGFILKGSGFHANDYPSSSGGASATPTRCGRSAPCCGRDSFCGSPKCES
jgi:putative FmdB family regulatory protein